MTEDTKDALLLEAASMLRGAADSERRAARMYAGGVINESDADDLADRIYAALAPEPLSVASKEKR